MNRKNTLLTLVMIFCTLFSVFSQAGKPDDLIIKVGEEIKTSKKEFIDKIIGKDDEGTYVMAKYADQMTIFYYLNDLTLKKKTSFKLSYQKKALSYRGIVQMGSEFFMFTTYRDKKKKMTYLYSQKLNKSTLEFNSPRELAHASYEGYKKRESASYSFKISADSNFLMFITDLPTGKKEDVDRFGLMVFDYDMEEVWSQKSIEIDETETSFYRYDSQIGNDGKVYLLAKIYDTSKKYKKGEINYTFEMMVYEADEGEPESFSVTLEGQFMSDVNFEQLDNGNIQVVGFYSDRGGIQNGVFNLIIDNESKEIVSEETTEFPTDFIVQHSSEKAKKKAAKREAKGKEVAFYSYVIDDLIENKDGTITMIGEQYRYYVTCTTDANGNQRCTYHYIYGNIIVVKFNEDGEVDWMELIPKYQHTTNDGGYYSGYALVELPDGTLKFIFNDSPKNSYYAQNGKFYGWKRSPKKTDIVLFSLTTEGRLDRYVLAKGDEEEVMSRPSVSVQIDANEMILLGEARKKTKFFKLTFED